MIDKINQNIERYLLFIVFIISIAMAVSSKELMYFAVIQHAILSIFILLGQYNDLPPAIPRTDHDELWKLANRSN